MYSLSIVSLGLTSRGSPSLITFLFIFTFFVTFTFSTILLHGVGNTGVLGSLFGLILVAAIFASVFDLLGLGVSVHEEINHDIPFLVTGDLVAEHEGLTGEEPEHVGNGEARFVVGRDGNINPVKRGVRVAKGNDGDPM